MNPANTGEVLKRARHGMIILREWDQEYKTQQASVMGKPTLNSKECREREWGKGEAR